jgi:hypothetical protein
VGATEWGGGGAAVGIRAYHSHRELVRVDEVERLISVRVGVVLGLRGGHAPSGGLTGCFTYHSLLTTHYSLLTLAIEMKTSSLMRSGMPYLRMNSSTDSSS